jgi:protease-4
MADSETDTQPSSAKIPEVNEPATVWERNLINRLVFAGISEQRRARRWSIFFKSLLALYLLILLLIYLPDDWSGSGMTVTRHTALLDLQGVIADDAEASADNIIQGLRAAFKDKNTAGIILRINSPGGSPVQAGYINDEIRRLRNQYPAVPLYAVITDICASGGYYVAVAADKIYADKASLVGSIGVLMDGFGFTGTMDKLGVERRLITAGAHKGFLDPFSPLNEGDVQHVQGLLGDIHRQFIDTVKRGRGKRLKEGADIYNGLVWTGEQSLGLGLIDGFGSSGYVAREVIGEANIVDFTPHENYLDRITQRFGVSMGKMFFSALGMQQEGNLRVR